MNWKTWLIHYAPKTWSIEEKHKYINTDCPSVTLEDVKRVLIANREISDSSIARKFREAEIAAITQDYEDLYGYDY